LPRESHRKTCTGSDQDHLLDFPRGRFGEGEEGGGVDVD
jgi:hypothetical protein